MNKFLDLLENTKPNRIISEDSKALSKTKHRYEDKEDEDTLEKVVTAQQYAKEHIRFMKLKQKKR